MSKKLSLILLTVILILAMVIPSSMVYAAEEKKVLTAEAHPENGQITVEGTVEEGMLAVAVQVCDKDEHFLFLRTGEVTSENKYKLVIEVEEGNYVLKVADFNGGTPKTVRVEIKEIDEINLTLSAPIIGDKVTSTKVSDEEYTQDNEPNVKAEEGANYSIDAARWISGTVADLGEKYSELLSTTFEKDKDYYAGMLVEAKNGYKFKENVTVKVNGEEPAEVHDLFGNGRYALVISKIKAVEKEENTNDVPTPKTGDTIVIFIAIFAVALVGMVVTTIIRKNKKRK